MLGQMPLQMNIPGMPAIPLPYASARWAVLLAAYIGYATMTLVGGLAGISLQAAGAGLFILLLAGRYGSLILPLRKNLLNLALLSSFLLPLVPLLLGTVATDGHSASYIIKYYAVYFVILVCLPLRLPPLYESKLRVPLFIAILMLLVAGMLLAHTGMGASERMKGLFTNPNNFALMAMSLLFVLREERDAWYVRWGVYGLVGGLILLSGTAGALLSFVAALGYRLIAAGKGRKLLVILLIAAGLLAMLVTGMLMLRDQSFLHSGPLGSVSDKVEIAYNNLELVFSDKAVNFYQASRGYSDDATSALWRLVHWKETFQTWQQGGWLCVLFGNGLGSSVPMMGILPHNDYLRFLFELGLLGLLANAVIWCTLFRQLQPASRWLLVMMAIYSFSENNFDNFLAMALLVFFSISARRPIHVLGRRLLENYRQMTIRYTKRNRHSEPAAEG
ncbi:MAG: O-antigen ligase family protein [Armatimonadota bacterium]